MHTEEQLIQKLIERDEDVFDTLIRRHQKMVFSIAYSMTGNIEDAEDITQEVFISAFKGIKGFKGRSSLKTWLYRITINACRRHRRKSSFRRIFSLNFLNREGDEGVYEIEDPHTPENHLMEKEKWKLINDAIKKLPSRQKEVFLLKHQEGLRLSEIAEVLGCPLGTVKANLFKAIKNLKNYMEAKG